MALVKNKFIKYIVLILVSFAAFTTKAQVDYDIRVKQSIISDSLILDLYVVNNGLNFSFSSGDFPLVIRNDDQTYLDVSNMILRDYSTVWSDKNVVNPNQFDPVSLSPFLDSIFNIQISPSVVFDVSASQGPFVMTSGDSVFIASVGIPIINCGGSVEVYPTKATGERAKWSNPMVYSPFPAGDIITNNAKYINSGSISLNNFPPNLNFYSTDSSFCGANEPFDLVLGGMVNDAIFDWNFYHYDLSTNTTTIIHTGNGASLIDTSVTLNSLMFEHGDSLFGSLNNGFCLDSSQSIPITFNAIANVYKTNILGSGPKIHEGCGPAEQMEVSLTGGTLAGDEIYEWFVNGSSTGVIGSSLYGPLYDGFYSAKVKTKGCILFTDTVEVKVHQIPDNSLIPNNVQTLCAGDSILFTVSSIEKHALVLGGAGTAVSGSSPQLNVLGNLSSDGFTVELWLDPTDLTLSPVKGILSKYTGAPNWTGFDMYIDASGKIISQLASNGVVRTLVSSTAIVVGDDSFLSLVLDRRDSSLTLYIDGVLNNQMKDSFFATQAFNNAGNFTLGIDQAGNKGYSGSMDELRVWSAPKSSAGIMHNYDKPISGSEFLLAGYWDFADTTNVGVAPNVINGGGPGMVFNGDANFNINGGFFESFATNVYTWSDGTSVFVTDSNSFYVKNGGLWNVVVDEGICNNSSIQVLVNEAGGNTEIGWSAVFNPPYNVNDDTLCVGQYELVAIPDNSALGVTYSMEDIGGNPLGGSVSILNFTQDMTVILEADSVGCLAYDTLNLSLQPDLLAPFVYVDYSDPVQVDFSWTTEPNATYAINLWVDGTQVLANQNMGINNMFQANAGNGVILDPLFRDSVSIEVLQTDQCSKLTSEINWGFADSCNAEFSGLDASYCTASFLSIITPEKPGGTFSGAGIISTGSLWYFDAQVAGPGSHDITHINCNDTVVKTTIVNAAPCTSTLVNDTTSYLVSEPQGIYTDCDGMVYVSSRDNNTIIRIDTFGVAAIMAGDSTAPAGFYDGPALAARMSFPGGILVDAAKNIYFADINNHAIRVVWYNAGTSTYTNVETIAGGGSGYLTQATGNGVFADLDGVGTAARLRNPFGLAFNPGQDTIYFTDAGNHKIKALVLATQEVITIAGSGTPGSGNGSLMTASFNAPKHLSYGNTGLYIADESNHQIRFLDFSTDLVSNFAGNAPVYITNANAGPSAGSDAGFISPVGVSYDGQGNVYTVGETSCALRRINLDSVPPYVTTLIGSQTNFTPVCGNGPNELNSPTALSVFVNGFIDIANTGANDLRRHAIEDFLNTPLDKFSKIDFCQSTVADTINETTVSGDYSVNGNPMTKTSDGKYWVFTPITPGFYDVCFNYSIGFCANSQCERIEIHANPTVNLGADFAVCFANALSPDTLVVDSTFSSIQWSYDDLSGGGYSVPWADTLSFKLIDTSGHYAVEVYDSIGCSATDTIVVSKRNPLPINITSSNANPLCAGDSTELEVVITPALGDPGVAKIRWSTNDTITSIYGSISGDYSVEVLDSGRCVARDTFRVLVNNLELGCIKVDTSLKNDLGAKYNEWIVGTISGIPGSTGSSIDGNVTSAKYNQPTSIYYHDSLLYVVESGAIRVLDLRDSSVTTVAGGGTLMLGDSIHVSDVFLDIVSAILVGENGKVFFATENSIYEIENDTIYRMVGSGISGYKNGPWDEAMFDGISDMAWAPNGVYVTDLNRNILRLIRRDRVVNTIIGDTITFTSGLNEGKGLNGTTLNLPYGVSYGLDGIIRLSHYGGGALSEIDLDSNITTVTASQVPPLNLPTGISTDWYGRTFFTETGANLVKVLNADGTIDTVAGSGNPLNANGIGSNASFYNPWDITFNENGLYYVADRDNHLIRSLGQNKTILICRGDSAYLDASCTGATNYTWLNPGGMVMSTGSAASYVYAKNEGTYTLNFDKNGCSSSDQVTIKYHQLPTLLGTSDSVMCAYDSVLVYAQSSVSGYQVSITGLDKWGTPLNITGLDSVALWVDSTLAQTFTLSLSNGICDTSFDVSIQVNDINLNIIASIDTLCFNENDLLSSRATGGVLSASSNYVYSWSQLTAGGSILPTNLDTARIFPGITYNVGANIYSLIVADDVGCQAFDTTARYMNMEVLPQIAADTTYICASGGAILTNVNSTATGGTPLVKSPFYRYNWVSVDGNLNLIAKANPTVTIVGLNIAPPYTSSLLSLEITDSLGCKNIDTTVIYVENIEYEPNLNHDTICSGMTVTLDTTALFAGSGGYRFAWLGEGIPANTDTLASTIGVPTSLDSTYYTLVVLDTITGCSSVDSAKVMIQPIVADINVDTLNICSGDTISLDGLNSYGAVEYKNGDAHTYVWNATSIVGSASQSSVVLAGGVWGSTEKVYLDVFDSLACNARDSVFLIWNSAVSSNIYDDSIFVCKGIAKQALSQTPSGASGAGYVFDWQVLSGTVKFEGNISNTQDVSFEYDTLMPSDTSVVVQIVVDSLGCMSVDTVVVIGIDFQVLATATFPVTCAGVPNPLGVQFIKDFNGPYTFDWSPATAVSDPNLENPNATPIGSEVFSVIVTDTKTGCSDTSNVSVDIVVTSAVINTATDPDTLVVCAMDSLALNASNSWGGTPFNGLEPYSYRWTRLNGGGTSFAVSDTNRIQYVKAGGAEGTYSQYELQILDSTGCDDRDTVTIYWNEPLLVSTAVDTSYICTPNSDTLRIGSITGGLGVYTSVWTLAVGAPASMSLSDSILTASDNDETDIYLTVTDAYGCVGADTLRAIGLDYQVDAVAKYDSICVGLQDTLFAVPTNDFFGSFTYQWTPIADVISPNNDTTLTSPTIDTRFYVQVVDAKTGCVANDSVDVGIREVVAVAGPTLNKDTLHVCFEDYGISTPFDASLSSGGERNTVSPFYASYTWTSSDVDITVSPTSGETSGANRNVDTPGYSEVYLEVTDLIGCTSRDTLVVHWNDSIQLILPTTTLPSPETALPVCLGIDSLSVVALGGTSPYSYAWSQSNLSSGRIVISGATTDSIVGVNVLSYGRTEFLDVTVTDIYSCSKNVGLLVKSYDLDINIVGNYDTVCSGSQVIINGSVNTPPDTVGNVIWTWDVGLTLTDNTTLSLNPTSDTSILAFAQDEATGCFDTSSVFVKVLDLDVQTSIVPNSRSICFEDSVVLDVISVIGGVKPYSYQWTDGVTFYSQDSIFIQPLNTGLTTYTLTVRDANSCDTNITVDITRNPEVIANAGDDASICVNQVMDLPNNSLASGIGGSGNFDYIWTSSPLITKSSTNSPVISVSVNPTLQDTIHSVYLTVVDQNNPLCMASDTVNVRFLSLPTVALPDTFFCENNAVVLDPGGIPYPAGTTFEWRRDVSTTIIGTSSTLVANTKGEYNVTVIGPLPENCENYDTVFVDQIELPQVNIQPINVANCSNEAVVLIADTIPVQGTLRWNVISPYGNQANFTDSTAVQTSYVPSVTDDSVVVVVSYRNVCAIDLDTVSFSTVAAPKISMQSTSLDISILQSVDFSDAGSISPSGNPLTYDWIFDGGTPGAAMGVGTHTVFYPDEGDWLVTYTIEDPLTQCQDDTNVIVHVKYLTTLYVPNVFSPYATNLDNQSLRVFGLNLSAEGFEFTVYNRWGEIVYESTDFVEVNTVGWTGDHYKTGVMQDAGVYTYVVKGQYLDGGDYSKTGTATLVR